MSDNVLKLIPVDQGFVPDRAAAGAAAAHLRRLFPHGAMCDAKVHGRLVFVDQGANLEAIICPVCARRIDLTNRSSPALTWWQTAIDFDDDRELGDVQIEMMCCRARVAFTTLKFDWPAGFARFELSIWDPNLAAVLASEQVAELERIVGCKLMQIHAHY